MEEYKLYFVAITSTLAFLLIMFEFIFPARRYERKTKINSYLTNSIIFVFNNIITILLGTTAVISIVLTYSPTTAYFISLPLWIQGILGIIILDFSIWVWHRLNHILPWLWIFHKCHHSETYLNTSSALRFHIGELLLSVVWKSIILIIFGIPLWVFLLSEFLLTAFAMFHHTNIKLSQKTRKILELFIISPYLHRVHHSDTRKEHDSNYGVIFTWWDTIFNTMKRVVPHKIGLKGTNEKNFLTFIIFPFRGK